MERKSYPNTGALFTERKGDNPKAPKYRGKIELSTELLRELVELARSRAPLELELAGWDQQGRSTEFITLKVQLPYKGSGRSDGYAPRQPRQDEGRSYASRRDEPRQDAPRREEPRGSNEPKRDAPRGGGRGLNDDLNDDIPWAPCME